MNLKQFSDEDLIAEIERRKTEANSIPPERTNLPYAKIAEKIYETVKTCVDEAITDGYWDDNNETYIAEATLNAFYQDFYGWKSKRFD